MDAAISLKLPVARFRHSAGKRRRYNFSLAETTYDRMADAAYAKRMTLSSLVESAVLEYIEKEEERNGKPFPPRPDDESS